jgi:Family of unknown function (DUF5719)
MRISSRIDSLLRIIVIGLFITALCSTGGLAATPAGGQGRRVMDSDNSTWYLAEGCTASGFQEYITIENPNDTGVTADITYMLSTGVSSPGPVFLQPLSQTTIDPSSTVGQTWAVATKIVARDSKPIAADRTMTWQEPGGLAEMHNSVGVTTPSLTWYLSEGSSAWGFETWLLLQNPGTKDATVQITYMLEGGPPVTVSRLLQANTRSTMNMADSIGAADASIRVTSDEPLVAERSMYRNNRREGHDSIGASAPANDYYLAEGATAWGFTTYVLVQNPGNSPSDVTITYMTPQGPVVQPTFAMPPNSRKTIRVNDALPGRDVSTRVHGSQPIIAERAMYWGGDTMFGEACHDSIGMDAMHTTFYLPDGDTTVLSDANGTGWVETWTCVQNPNPVSVKVRVDYYGQNAADSRNFSVNIPANSRATFNMADHVVNARAAIKVTCLTAGRKVMAERAMYLSVEGNRIAGAESIGAYSDD